MKLRLHYLLLQRWSFFPLKVESSSNFMLCFNLFYFTRNTNKNSPRDVQMVEEGRKEGRMLAERFLCARPGSGPTALTPPAGSLASAAAVQCPEGGCGPLWLRTRRAAPPACSHFTDEETKSAGHLGACPKSHRWAFGRQDSNSGLCNLKAHFGGAEIHSGQIS